MTPQWVFQVLLVIIGALIAAVFYLLQEKHAFAALYSGAAAAILIIFLVTLYIRNDLMQREAVIQSSTHSAFTIGEISSSILHTGSGHIYVFGTKGVSEETFQRLAEDLGITKAALNTFFRIIEQKQVPAEDLDNTLRKIAHEYKELQNKLLTFTSEEPEIVSLKRQASEALQRGEFQIAESFLNQASERGVRSAQQMATVRDELLLGAAASKAENAELKKSQLAYTDAAEYYRQAIQLVPEAKPEDLANYLNLLGETLINAGEYSQSEDPLKKALNLRKTSFGEEHPSVAQSYNNLGTLYLYLGKYQEVKPYLERALTIWRKTLGKEDPSIAICLGNLAGFHHTQANHHEAESLYYEALKIQRKVLGPFHTQVAATLHNMATLFKDMGQYEKAKEHEIRSLAIWEDVVGPEHPSVAISLNNLGTILTFRGESPKAKEFYERALLIREKIFGPEHTAVAESLHNLAALYQDQGDYKRALSLHLRALRISEKVLGPEHPEIAARLSAVGLVQHREKNYPEAESYYKRALSILENNLRKNHPDIAHILNNLGGLYYDEGFYHEAESYHRRALSIREEAFGAEHPDVANSLNSLALALAGQGKTEEAALLFERSLDVLEKRLGPQHPHTTLVRKNISSLHKTGPSPRKGNGVELKREARITDHEQEKESPMNDKKRSPANEGDKPILRIPLEIMPQPLKEPKGTGRVLFQNPSETVASGRPTVLYICGSCSTPLLNELEMIKFSATIAPNTEIVIRCNKCGAYNDATKYVR